MSAVAVEMSPSLAEWLVPGSVATLLGERRILTEMAEDVSGGDDNVPAIYERF